MFFMSARQHIENYIEEPEMDTISYEGIVSHVADMIDYLIIFTIGGPTRGYAVNKGEFDAANLPGYRVRVDYTKSHEVKSGNGSRIVYGAFGALRKIPHQDADIMAALARGLETGAFVPVTRDSL